MERASTIAAPVRLLLAAALLLGACGDPYGGKLAPRADDERVEAPAAPIVTAPAHGFGEAIRWEPLDEGLARAKAQGLPVMLVVHAGWCPRCKELKASFFDAALERESRRFVMVNVDADAEPRSQQPPYIPDGDYIPRVMFVDPDTGAVDTTLVNTRRTRTRYFYTPADDLVAVMQQALRRHEST